MTAVDESEQWGFPDTAIGRAALQLMVDASPDVHCPSQRAQLPVRP